MNYLKGGKGDNHSFTEFDHKEVQIGIRVESEHVTDLDKILEIVVDHLSDNPTYYSELCQSGLVDEPSAMKVYNKLFKENRIIFQW